ncbi:hypothetical protein LTS15_002661 [Exophiala xenobiotica]|nr:hypothetical protein LTS15_002661 [Exophiala xenobiotica]
MAMDNMRPGVGRHKRVSIVGQGRNGGCTNCHLDNRRCIVLASRRGKGDAGQDGGANEGPKYQPSRLLSPAGGDTNLNVARQSSRTSHESMSTPVEQAGSDDVPICVTFDRNDELLNSDQQPTNDNITTDHMPSKAHHGAQKLLSSVLDHHRGSSGMMPLPDFIAPYPSRIPAEDLEFLVRKGAFTVPDPELRAELLRGYVFCVYPFMPMLDLKAFVEAVLNDRKDGRVSLLLFQAVMFAGISSLEPHHIHRLGFDSAKQAREVFFTRVKLLYEFDVELDGTAVVQTLLLMSSWHSKWNAWRDTWHWAGLALLVAQNMGLHREPTSACGSDKEQRCRRRLWWSLYIRDRMLALGTRRPMRIRDDDFNVAMLTLEDFDIQPLTEGNHGRPITPDAKELRRTALMCIELAKLCVCIGHALSSQYTTLSTEPNISHTMMVVPKGDRPCASDLRKCDDEIGEWFQGLTPDLYTSGSQTPHAGAQSCSDLHWAMLNLAHLTLINVLHRTQALQPTRDTAEAQAVRRSSRSKVKDSARKVTKIAQALLRRGQVRFLGLNGITAMLAACLSHLVDIRSQDGDVQDASVFRFYQNMQVLQSMQTMYSTADSAVSFLTSVIGKAGLPLPPQTFLPSADPASSSADYLSGTSTSHNGQSAPMNAVGPRSGSWFMTNEPSEGTGADWSAEQFQPQSGSESSRPTQALQFLDAHGQTLNHFNGETSTAGLTSDGAFNVPKDGPTTGPGFLSFAGPHDESLCDPTANDPFFDWICDVHNAMELEPIFLSSDFFPDSLGYLDNRSQGM